MIIAVDFDGTLCDDKFPEIGKPNLKLINRLIFLQENMSVELLLWTCRCGDSLQDAIDWCADFGLHFDGVNDNSITNKELYDIEGRKIFADIYIDDRAMSPSDFIENINF